MDLHYLRQHPDLLPMMLTHQRIRETPVPGGSTCQARRLTLDDGTSLFVKSVDGPPARQPAPPSFFETEAAGLRWLAAADAVAIPEVVAVLPDLLALEWVEAAEPTPQTAERFGRDLARLHDCGADTFGAPQPGYIGSLPQDNTPSSQWPQWFAERRLRPYLRRSAETGALSPADFAEVEHVINTIDRYALPPRSPARLHGDLWPGNLLWSGDRVWLVDPAAHGGHPETDLAQLALFGGAPYLSRIIAAYREVSPLADGWRERVPLHQLPLLLVHTALFGATYRDTVMDAVRRLARHD